jgi:hypothetical protein
MEIYGHWKGVSDCKKIWYSRQNTMDIIDILVVVYDIGKTI